MIAKAHNGKRHSIAGAIALYTAGGLFWAFLPFFVGLQTERGGLTAAAAGLLGTAYLAGFTLCSIFAVWWAQQLNLRRCVLAAVIAIIGSFWMLGTTAYFSLSLAACLVIGNAMGALWVIAYRVFGQAANPDRTFALAIGISYPVLALVTLIASRLIIPHSGLTGVMTTIVLLVGVFGLGATQLPEQVAISGGAATSVSRSEVPVSGILSLIGLFLSGFAFACIWSLAAKIGTSAGFDAGHVGAVLSFNLLLTGVGSLTASALGTRLGRAGPLLGALIFIAVCMATLLDRSSFPLFAAAIIGLGFGVGLAMPFQLAVITDTDHNGKLVSLIAAVQGLGTAMAPPMAGWLFDGHGADAIACIGFTSIVLSTICFLLALRDRTANPSRV